MEDNRDSEKSFSDYEQLAERRLRLDAEWTTLIALRDTIGFALRGRGGNTNATYKQAFILGNLLLPQLFDPETSILQSEQLSEKAKTYIQKAEALSEIEKRTISPEDLVGLAIAEHDRLLHTETVLHGRDLIRKELSELQNTLKELEKRKNTENSLIFRDAYRVDRGYPISGNGRNYKDFKISEEKVLRIRVLHPDKPEHAVGADLIYENYLENRNVKLVRLAAVQYKIWKDKSLRLDERARNQLEKLKSTFCDRNMCLEDKNGQIESYRLPHCSAFLRPTDELQLENAQLLSIGYYTPICVVKRQQRPTPKGNAILRGSDIMNESLSHKVFEEMFNKNMLGSRWLKYKELEDLYHSSSVLEPNENIIIHVQEIPAR